MTDQGTLHERIRERAYQLWEADGCPAGDDWKYWLAAEQDVNAPPAPPKANAEAEAAPKSKPKPKAKAKPAAATDPAAAPAKPARPRAPKAAKAPASKASAKPKGEPAA